MLNLDAPLASSHVIVKHSCLRKRNKMGVISKNGPNMLSPTQSLHLVHAFVYVSWLQTRSTPTKLKEPARNECMHAMNAMLQHRGGLSAARSQQKATLVRHPDKKAHLHPLCFAFQLRSERRDALRVQ